MDINKMKCTIEGLVGSGKLKVIPDTEKSNYERIKNLDIPFQDVEKLINMTEYIGITDEFRKVIKTFNVPEGEIPAGFRPEFVLSPDGSVHIDLIRDISYASNGVKRPTKVLYSANTADPFEVEVMKDLIANLTTNPQIIHSQFLNNPKANVGNKFKNKYEVLEELCRIVGPGVDISVEFDDPFAPENELMEEIKRLEDVLTPYRLVVKVPHTGSVNKNNVDKLLNKKFELGYEEGAVEDNFYGHNLAYKLSMKGYRVNFTLMSDPCQTELALLARPYFINTFVEVRNITTKTMDNLIKHYDVSGEKIYADRLKQYMIDSDIISYVKAADMSDADIVKKARDLLAYRNFHNAEGSDGLDSVRHSLRVLRQSNLENTRLIICNMNAPQYHLDLDKLLREPEFCDMVHRVILTNTPSYFGQFTSSPEVLHYNRRFLLSAQASAK
jgi:hypothetical protein